MCPLFRARSHCIYVPAYMYSMLYLCINMYSVYVAYHCCSTCCRNMSATSSTGHISTPAYCPVQYTAYSTDTRAIYHLRDHHNQQPVQYTVYSTDTRAIYHLRDHHNKQPVQYITDTRALEITTTSAIYSL